MNSALDEDDSGFSDYFQELAGQKDSEIEVNGYNTEEADIEIVYEAVEGLEPEDFSVHPPVVEDNKLHEGNYPLQPDLSQSLTSQAAVADHDGKQIDADG